MICTKCKREMDYKRIAPVMDASEGFPGHTEWYREFFCDPCGRFDYQPTTGSVDSWYVRLLRWMKLKR